MCGAVGRRMSALQLLHLLLAPHLLSRQEKGNTVSLTLMLFANAMSGPAAHDPPPRCPPPEQQQCQQAFHRGSARYDQIAKPLTPDIRHLGPLHGIEPRTCQPCKPIACLVTRTVATGNTTGQRRTVREDSTASCSASRSAVQPTCMSLISSRSASSCCLQEPRTKGGSNCFYLDVYIICSNLHLLLQRIRLLPARIKNQREEFFAFVKVIISSNLHHADLLLQRLQMLPAFQNTQHTVGRVCVPK